MCNPRSCSPVRPLQLPDHRTRNRVRGIILLLCQLRQARWRRPGARPGLAHRSTPEPGVGGRFLRRGPTSRWDPIRLGSRTHLFGRTSEAPLRSAKPGLKCAQFRDMLIRETTSGLPQRATWDMKESGWLGVTGGQDGAPTDRLSHHRDPAGLQRGATVFPSRQSWGLPVRLRGQWRSLRVLV